MKNEESGIQNKQTGCHPVWLCTAPGRSRPGGERAQQKYEGVGTLTMQVVIGGLLAVAADGN